MTLEITERQRKILYNALCNRSEMLWAMVKIYTQDDNDELVLSGIQERTEIREIKRKLREL